MPSARTANAAPASTAAPRIPMVANAGRHVVGSVGTAVNTNPSATAQPHSGRPSAADTASIAPRPTASQPPSPTCSAHRPEQSVRASRGWRRRGQESALSGGAAASNTAATMP